VNGFNLGRYWSVGPQQTLYIPAPLLMTGVNEVTKHRNVAVLTKPRLSKKAAVYFFIMTSGLCFCICENTGLLNQSDTEVNAMGDIGSWKIVGRNVMSKTRIISLGLIITHFDQTSRFSAKLNVHD